MRLLVILSALALWALASPAALAEPCRGMEMGEAGEPVASSAGTPSATEPGSCCSPGSGCGVCCLAPTPVAPEPATASVTPSVTAAVFAGVVLRPAARGRVFYAAPSGDAPPRLPERPGASGPRGPPAD